MAKPTNPQDQSPLFATLPLEIRRVIYEQLWKDCGLTQHIYATTEKSYLLSFPCILSPEKLNQNPRLPAAPSVPNHAAGTQDNAHPNQPQSRDDDPGDIDGAIQDLSGGDTDMADADEPEPPNSTPWCTHFACFRNRSRKWNQSFYSMYTALYRRNERLDRPDLAGSAVLTTFLVCKRMYQEASEALFSQVRFSFWSMAAMDIFLGEVPRDLLSRIRFVDIVSGNLGCLHTNKPPFNSIPPAQEVYDKVKASLPKLRELRVTLHPLRRYEPMPQKQELEPFYALGREMESLRRFEVLLPARCEIVYGEAPPWLQDAPFTVMVVSPGWHESDDCLFFGTTRPRRNL